MSSCPASICRLADVSRFHAFPTARRSRAVETSAQTGHTPRKEPQPNPCESKRQAETTGLIRCCRIDAHTSAFRYRRL